MVRRVIMSTIAAILLLTQGVFAMAPPNSAVGATKYLQSRQDSEGRIENDETSAWAAIAFGAVGIDAADILAQDVSLRDYLTTRHPNDGDAAIAWERQVLALLAMGVDPRSVDGKDHLAAIEQFSHDGQIGDPELLTDDIFGILALTGAGNPPSSPIVASSLRFLLEKQNDDGGWGPAVGSPSDVDQTSRTLQALGPPPEDSSRSSNAALIRAVDFLRAAQNADGGFPKDPGGQSNAVSTASAVQAIVALGEDPDQWIRDGATPLAFLDSLEDPSGGFSLSVGEPPSALVTSFVIPALLRKPLPVRFTPPTAPPTTVSPPDNSTNSAPVEKTAPPQEPAAQEDSDQVADATTDAPIQPSLPDLPPAVGGSTPDDTQPITEPPDAVQPSARSQPATEKPSAPLQQGAEPSQSEASSAASDQGGTVDELAVMQSPVSPQGFNALHSPLTPRAPSATLPLALVVAFSVLGVAFVWYQERHL